MKSHSRIVFVFCIVCSIYFLTGNTNYAEENGGMLQSEDSIENVDLENANRLVLETLKYDSQKYKQRSIKDKALISRIIREVKNCELISPEFGGHLVAHNQLLSFYQNGTKLLELKFFIHKDYPQVAFFKYYYYSPELGKLMDEYIVGNEFYQLLSSLIESIPEGP